MTATVTSDGAYVALTTDCTDIGSDCEAGLPSLTVPMQAGTTYYFIATAVEDDVESVTLEIKQCTPECTNKTCGSDGCGGNCGECDDATEGCSVTAEGASCVPKTCDGFCGSQSTGGCYCDSACVGAGDCCDDFCDFCSEIDPAFCAEP